MSAYTWNITDSGTVWVSDLKCVSKDRVLSREPVVVLQTQGDLCWPRYVCELQLQIFPHLDWVGASECLIMNSHCKFSNDQSWKIIALIWSRWWVFICSWHSKAAVVCILSVHFSFVLFHKGHFKWLTLTAPKCIKKERRIMHSLNAVKWCSQTVSSLLTRGVTIYHNISQYKNMYRG